MKKRLISLLVALCMAVTLLPVSAITAWAEESGSNLKPLQFRQGYPVLDGITPTPSPDGHIYTGDGWSYDATAKVLTIAPESPTTYDLKDYGSIRKDYNSIACSTIIEKNATIVNGSFLDIKNPGSSITNDGTITSGTYSMPVINHGTITGGIFRKKPTGGNVDNGYTLNVNSQQNGSYESFHAEIKDLGSSVYVIPNSYYNTSVTILYGFFDSWPETLFPIDVTFGNTNDTHCLLKDWAPSARYHYNVDHVYVTFTAPPAKADTVTLSKLTRLVIDENGYPVGTKGGTQNYSGNGWKFENGNKKLTLTSGSYDFSGEENALGPLNPDVQLVVESGATLTGGAAGDGSGVTWQLTENTDDPSTYKLTISGSGAMEDFPFGSYQPWYSFHDQITSVVVSPGVTSIGQCAFSRFAKLTHVDIADSVISIGWDAFCNCTKLTSITIPDSVTTIDLEAFKNCSSLTSITIPGSVTSIGPYVFDGCTSLNDIRYSGTSESVISALSGYVPTLVTFDYGDKVPEAERMIKVFVKTGGTLTAPTTLPNVVGYEFKGWLTEDGELYDFPGAPTGQLTLYAKWEKIPEPKPEPTPDPEPEAPTYTLTVKGGTFTYNGGEAMTSASVPVDAEVKVTLNQSAVPEGMVFDLWAMDEASLLGNPAVAYNEESFTIPAGSVAKGSTVTVEAQYRDATIESEPSILGTAAIIGVAGAGTAVIVWQGYRIGMELYEKYFQPTPEETAVVEPTLEGQMTDPIS